MPRYIVWVSTRQFYTCETLAEAADWRKQTGGIIYEPLGLTAAERIAAEPDQYTQAETYPPGEDIPL